MFAELSQILAFVLENFLRMWPYLLLTIPLAVGVRLSGASRFIRRAFQARPWVAILLATLVGAFSPFCSCTVIPVVASLLIGGVPLGPVMAFWVASPSMDPEIFFLSVAMIGWELALWRLVGTLALSLAAGFLTQFLVTRGALGDDWLRPQASPTLRSPADLLRAARDWAGEFWGRVTSSPELVSSQVKGPACQQCSTAAAGPVQGLVLTAAVPALPVAHPHPAVSPARDPEPRAAQLPLPAAVPTPSFWDRLWHETRAAVWMVMKFMTLAFVLEALITLYVPEAWIAALLGSQNPFAIPFAALLGVPVYTSNLAALPMIGGLLSGGMHPGAALAFLIAGPTTTLPAMAAVYGLVQRRVFALYLAFALVGAVCLGFLYALVVHLSF